MSTTEPPDKEASQAPAPAPELEGEPSTALDDAVLPKLEEGGCECVAVVRW